jgi:hypothetical protein
MLALVFSGCLFGDTKAQDLSTDPVATFGATTGLRLNLAMKETLVDTTVTGNFSEWLSKSLSGLVPSGTFMIYIEMEGSYENGGIGDAILEFVRQAGVETSDRELIINGQGYGTREEGNIYAWLQVDRNNPTIEYFLRSIDTPGAVASMNVQLRGYIAARQ